MPSLDPLEQTVAQAIRRHGLLPDPLPGPGGGPAPRVVVALSGGADSVALLAALTALGYECVAAHCNFHLRGQESNRDMRHAMAVASLLGADVSVRHFDVDARRRDTGESLEMACRELRYRWFGELLDIHHAVAVAVGHHLEDSVETLLLNLLRGTGIGGVGGIRPRNGHVVRPLLQATRPQIEDYLRRRGLTWVDDSTNAQSDVRRNRLRNLVIPRLEELFPGATEALARSMDHLAQCRDFYDQQVQERRHAWMDHGPMDLAALRRNEPSAPLLLYEWLRPLGFNRSQTDDMLAGASSGRSGRVFQAPGPGREARAVVDRGRLEIVDAPAGDGAAERCWPVDPAHPVLTPTYVAVSRHMVGEFSPERDPRVMCLDERALGGDPRWELRHWHRGDYMEPFGMDGRRRKLSDIFTDAKLSVAAKERVWLLTRDGTVVWALGLRTSRHWPITPDTRRYLRLEWKE